MGGFPEEHSPPGLRRGESPKIKSSYVMRSVTSEGSFDLRPGGVVEHVVISGKGAAEVRDLEHGASIRTASHKGSTRHSLTDHKSATVRVHVRKLSEEEEVDAVVFATGTTDAALELSIEDPNVLVNSELTLHACATSEESALEVESASATVIYKGEATIVSATIQGTCADVRYVPPAAGQYRFEVQLQGTATSVNSTQHFDRSGVITTPAVESLGQADCCVISPDPIFQDFILLQVSGKGTGPTTAGTRRVVGSAVLVGHQSEGLPEDIAFTKHILNVDVDDDGTWTADLRMNAKWLSHRGHDAKSAYSLRDFQLSDTAGAYITIAAASSVHASAPHTLSLPKAPGSVTDDMREYSSARPSPKTNARKMLQFLPHQKLLLHGHCSGGTWEPGLNRGDFTYASAYANHHQSRSNDAFAQEVIAWSETIVGPDGGCGIIAHSQGGMVAAHIKTYYSSCLDRASVGNSRIIQSVGTPYQGTPLASLAIFGDLFGYECELVHDLTLSGASAWLGGIPNSVRSQVWYGTTQGVGGGGGFGGLFPSDNSCDIRTDLLLGDPEDGVVEKERAILPGANYIGHGNAHCHNSGMKYPPQTENPYWNHHLDVMAKF
eukprot:CAMPEP_0181309834 /NCGR_PEP_ID=MMETSP1101-20121128/12238_1 /TAXON_ID=46948 /ORGANISM="Rhodomonas abbreviata, Strain Caron Lab Isolate" /LENGTH=606 /DNA_ID=CAMNT_0023416371 /DNA_START=136 /DNA_END=1956 /DNA_ORIENTATION=+